MTSNLDLRSSYTFVTSALLGARQSYIYVHNHDPSVIDTLTVYILTVQTSTVINLDADACSRHDLAVSVHRCSSVIAHA